MNQNHLEGLLKQVADLVSFGEPECDEYILGTVLFNQLPLHTPWDFLHTFSYEVWPDLFLRWSYTDYKDIFRPGAQIN